MSQPPQITTADIVEHFSMQPTGGFTRLELLRDAAAIIDGIPDEQFDLDDVYSSFGAPSAHNCGTIACAIGWLALHPGFNAVGLRADHKGNLRWQHEQVGFVTAARELFNLDGYDSRQLFGPAQLWETTDEDREATAGKPVGALHKRIFMRRVKRLLQDHGYTRPEDNPYR